LPLANLRKSPDLVLLKSFGPDPPVTTFNGYAFEVHIFQKATDRDRALHGRLRRARFTPPGHRGHLLVVANVEDLPDRVGMVAQAHQRGDRVTHPAEAPGLMAVGEHRDGLLAHAWRTKLGITMP
jgi:hypothetical protein